MPTRLAVFDCDGTLVDGAANICTAMESVFAAAGRTPPPRPRIRAIVGLSLGEAMQRLCPEATPVQHDALEQAYRTTYRAMREAGTLEAEPLYDGIVTVLDALRDDGWTLGIATGKSDRGLAHVLAQHAIADRFVTLQTADRHPSKPDPAMLHDAIREAGAAPKVTAMIGDTAYDMAMARAAGTRAIGVAWGYHTPAELMAAGAHIVVDRPDQLPDRLKEHP